MPIYVINGKEIQAESTDDAYEQLDAMKSNEYHPIHDMGTGERLMAGAGRGLHNIYRTVGEFLGADLNDEELDKIDEALLNTTAGAAGNLAGEIAGTLPVGGVLGNAVAKGAALARPLAGRVAQGAVQGATEGAVASGMTGGDVGEGAGLGGVVGGAVPGIGAAARFIGRPATVSDDAARLEQMARDQGLELGLTPGQRAAPEGFGGFVKGTEEALENIPGGTPLKLARQSSMAKWNQAEMRDALPADLAESVTTNGPKGMEQARKALSAAYDDVLKDIPAGRIHASQEVLDSLADLENMIVSRIDESTKPKMLKEVQNLFEDMYSQKLDGRNLKEWERTFRQKAERAGKGGDIQEAEVYRGLRDIVAQQAEEVLGPQGANRLREIDASYARFAPLRDAGAYVGAISEGVFTPSQLRSAANKGQSQWGKSTARNPATQRGIAAEEVFGTTLPRVGPGTAEKLATQAITGGLANTAVNLAAGDLEGSDFLYGALGGVAAANALPKMRGSMFGETALQGGIRNAQPFFDSLGRLRPYLATGAALSQ